MGLTNLGNVNATNAKIGIGTSLPTTPASYYDIAANDVLTAAWKGGEFYYLTTDDRLYIQTATSGTTATWKRCVTKFTTP